MNISAKELAKLINVSPATVSMVFNNKPGISDATRELVLKTAAEYGYAPQKMKPPALPPALFSWSIIRSTERSLPTRRSSPS